MNWFQKIATPLKIYQWRDATKKAIEMLIPGQWTERDFSDDFMYRSALFGADVMLKPNSRFFVQVTMRRRDFQTREFDSAIGHKNLTFECHVKASSHDQWPVFGDLLGHEQTLDTPYEVAKFVQGCIQNYDPKDNGSDGDKEPTPDVPMAPSQNAPVNAPALV